MDRANPTDPNESAPDRHAAERENTEEREQERQREHDRKRAEAHTGAAPNPPRTTTGKMTSPKFGSATSGGGELEPGPEQD
jgi:hypothetical protein